MSVPFSPGTVSLGSLLGPDDPRAAIDRLLREARIAEEAGFDGMTVSEHHGGHPGYLPNPTLAANWILDATERLWSGPCPTVLPLRDWQTVVEDLAWTLARFPGRVAAGVAPGYLPRDFALLDRSFDDRARDFSAAVTALAGALASGDGIGADPALRAGAGGVPLVSAAGSRTAAQRAARVGTGLLVDSVVGLDRLRELTGVYRETGGTGPVVVNRRVWVGPAPTDDLARQFQGYREGAAPGAWLARENALGAVASGDPASIIEHVRHVIEATAPDAIALRLHVPGVAAELIEQQVRLAGDRLLPDLRKLLREAHPTVRPRAPQAGEAS